MKEYRLYFVHDGQDESYMVGDILTPQKYEPMPDAKIKELAQGIYTNDYFTSLQCPLDMIEHCFMPLIFLDLHTQKMLADWKIATCYAPISDAAPRSINGYPCFFSVGFLNRADTVRLLEVYEKISRFMENL